MEVTPLEILHHDEFVIAVNKPAGVFVHQTEWSSPDETNVVRMLRNQIGRLVTPVHRLDRATSGVLLFGLDADTTRHLAAQFSEHSIQKTYLAIVRGHTPDEVTIDRPLRPHRDGLTSNSEATTSERDALTGIRTLDRTEIPHSAGKYPTSRYSLIEAFPKTGRRHQIRRHLKHISHPIVGDVSHGDHRHNHMLKELCGLNRLMLVATRLEFTHPHSVERLTIEASVGPEFESLSQFLKLSL